MQQKSQPTLTVMTHSPYLVLLAFKHVTPYASKCLQLLSRLPPSSPHLRTESSPTPPRWPPPPPPTPPRTRASWGRGGTGAWKERKNKFEFWYFFFLIFLTWRMGRSGSRWGPPDAARQRRWGGCRWSGTGKLWICERCAALSFPNKLFLLPFLLK